MLAKVRSEPAERLDDIFREAQGASARSLIQQVDAYLDEFGYRNANDLKLEEPDLREDLGHGERWRSLGRFHGSRLGLACGDRSAGPRHVPESAPRGAFS